MALKFGPDILDRGPQGTKRGKKLSAFGRAFKLAYDTKPGSTFTFGGKKYKAIKKQEGKGPSKDRVEDKSIGAGTIIKGKRDTTKKPKESLSSLAEKSAASSTKKRKAPTPASGRFGQRKAGGMMDSYNKGGLPDFSGDGKITKKDVLMGRGVIPKPKKANKGTMIQARGCGVARKKPTKIT